jgi:hypothetical protein
MYLIRKVFKKTFRGFRQPYDHPPAILLTDPAIDHQALLHTVYQLDRAVVAELQSFGKIADSRAVVFPGEAFYRQKQLMLHKESVQSSLAFARHFRNRRYPVAPSLHSEHGVATA